VLAAGDRSVLVRVYPLGVDPGPLLERAAEPDVAEAQQQLRAEVGTARIIGRVDRTEPAKNVQVGLLAFADLLDRWPEHREQVIHVVLAYPSRQDVAEYRDYTELCQQTAAEINARFATPQWQPINFEVRDDYPRSLATLRSCDVMLINPLRDGMNLVAKEGALLSHDAVLVLSREAGAADQMGEYALLVDPADVSGTAEALAAALAMPADERARRHRGLREIAAALPPHAWLERQLADLAAATADS
jgi:trehalose 6-phosphate synthase